MIDKSKNIYKIGITGGIGSGKSEVCKILEKHDEKVLYADEIAKELTDNDDQIKNEIRRVFGSDVFDSAETLNRQKLGSIIFSDENLKNKLNKIVHPPLFLEINKKILKFQRDSNCRCIFIEAAIIYESKMDRNLDYVVVIDADIQKRIERVRKRNNYDLKKIDNIFKSQLPAEEKNKKADFVIFNNGSLNELEEKVVFIKNLFSSI